MGTKNVLFTFDYELFLGKKSGSVDKCVIQPAGKLLSVFAEHKISRAIFFVDITWLNKLKGITASYSPVKNDYEKVVKQLREIYAAGHYVFPHLHPHWIDATYLPELNQWQLINYSLYRFHNLDKQEREDVFLESVKHLREILGADYKPIAYRAGGWSLQPFEDFEPLFRKHGVKYDFSVLPGAKYISAGQHYDFSDVIITNPYSFANDVTVSGKGDFMEFPISRVRISQGHTLRNKFLLKYLTWSGNNPLGDGQGIVAEARERSDDSMEMVSVELLTKVKLPLYNSFLKKNNYMQFIGHPKMISEHNLKMLGRFLAKAKSSHTIETDFLKIAAKQGV
jgi:hypothetical protein